MDLTKITTPYGLLDAETQKALKEHGGPYQCYTLNGVWQDLTWDFDWMAFHVYRVKPEPPRPREIWGLKYSSGAISCLHFGTKDQAMHNAPEGAQAIRFVEVIE